MMQDSSSSSPRTTLIISQHYSIKIKKVFSRHVSRMFSPSRCSDHNLQATSRHAARINAGQPAGLQWRVIVCIAAADCSRDLCVRLLLPVQGQFHGRAHQTVWVRQSFPHPVLVVVIPRCWNSSGRSCEHASVQSGFLFASARRAKCRWGLSCQAKTRKAGRNERMLECLVYAAVEVSQQDFEGGSMFRYGNKTQAFTKISRHLGTGQHRDLLKHEDGEFSINQIKHMLDDAMCKFEDSGKKSATNGGRCQSGRNDIWHSWHLLK